MTFQITILILTILGGGFYFFLLKTKNKKVKTVSSSEKETAQEFVNIKDVKGKFAYSKDGLIFMYIKINSISIDLLSDREKKTLTRQLTTELSAYTDEFKFTAISRPVDMSKLINEYHELLVNSTDIKQKTLLKKEMAEINNYAMSGEIVERQFIQQLWVKVEKHEAEKEILKKAENLISSYSACGIKAEILSEKEIIRFLNLFSNPAYINLEDVVSEPTIPIII